MRPDHRMIAHTGFLITARRLAPGHRAARAQAPPVKTDFSDDDFEAWTPGALGERSVSDKALRKRVRAADAAAARSRAAEPDADPSTPRTPPCPRHPTTSPTPRTPSPRVTAGRLPTPLSDPSKNRGSVRSSLALIATAGLVAVALSGCATAPALEAPGQSTDAVTVTGDFGEKPRVEFPLRSCPSRRSARDHRRRG